MCPAFFVGLIFVPQKFFFPTGDETVVGESQAHGAFDETRNAEGATGLHTHTHKHTHTHTHKHTHTHTHIHKHTRTHTDTHTDAHTYAHKHTHAYTHKYTHEHTHKRTHTHTHTQIEDRLTHRHTSVQSQMRAGKVHVYTCTPARNALLASVVAKRQGRHSILNNKTWLTMKRFSHWVMRGRFLG